MRPEQCRNLPARLRRRHGDVYVGLTKPTVPFRNFVLENGVIAEGTPDVLIDCPMILVAVVALVAEDQIGPRQSLERLEELLDLSVVRGEATVRKVTEVELAPGCWTHQRPQRRCRLRAALGTAAQHDPVDTHGDR